MNKIIICGPGGSGKDELKKRFIDKGFNPSISYTTRPKRSKEIEDVDYHYTNDENFKHLIKTNQIFEYNIFNDWYYGTHIDSFKLYDIFIMTPNTINNLPINIRNKSIVFYLNIDENIRFKRLSSRNDSDDVQRRINADKEMFNNFSNYDIVITNPNF